MEGNHGSRWFQMWKWDNGYLVNDRGKVLAIVNKQDSNGSNMGVQNKNGEEHQQWELIYADELPPEPKKGELNKTWGIYVQRPFHIVSSLDSGKYIDLIGNNAVIKTPNGRTSQSWWFDQRTKTIKSWRTRSYTL
jgi:hypothetical protein